MFLTYFSFIVCVLVKLLHFCEAFSTVYMFKCWTETSLNRKDKIKSSGIVINKYSLKKCSNLIIFLHFVKFFTLFLPFHLNVCVLKLDRNQLQSQKWKNVPSFAVNGLPMGENVRLKIKQSKREEWADVPVSMNVFNDRPVFVCTQKKTKKEQLYFLELLVKKQKLIIDVHIIRRLGHWNERDANTVQAASTVQG